VSGVDRPWGRRIAAKVLEAERQAEAILESARESARLELAEARRQCVAVHLRAEEEARADAVAKVAAHALALEAREAKAEERQLDRVVELARLLAERLLGEALELDPTRVRALARQVLHSARAARSITISAHPRDVAALERLKEEPMLKDAAMRVEADPDRQRGSLRLVTELGILDADLAPQLTRLAQRLREMLSE
jgi:flagellar assembly protein FliH/type III secretion protein L